MDRAFLRPPVKGVVRDHLSIELHSLGKFTTQRCLISINESLKSVPRGRELKSGNREVDTIPLEEPCLVSPRIEAVNRSHVAERRTIRDNDLHDSVPIEVKDYQILEGI